ncbi:MAG: PadR family transcriptional regulator [Propionicimonas sp.]|jgi:DNA-binding PadR family transcriptional regulator
MSHTQDAFADPAVFLRKLADWGMKGPLAGGLGAHPRARRGDTRAAILKVLAEKPMHGYQIIQELGQRSGGLWRPSAGSVYPTLQMLADEGLIVATETAGKKVFSLTDDGEAAVADLADEPAPWDVAAALGDVSGVLELREAGARLASAVLQVARTPDKDKTDKVVEILNSARKQVYTLLAED